MLLRPDSVGERAALEEIRRFLAANEVPDRWRAPTEEFLLALIIRIVPRDPRR
ncbi:MAG: hypothetical protein ACRECT_00265 [Thermoplasmata archaeon]